MSDLLTVGLVFLVCGLLQMMLIPSAAWYIWRLRRRDLHTTGTVLDHIADPSTVVRMGAEFVDQHGQNVSLVTDRLNTPYTGVFAVGQKLEILYLPARPTDARPAKMPLPKPPRRNLHASYISLLLFLIKTLPRFSDS